MLVSLLLVAVIVSAGYALFASVAGLPHRCKECGGTWHGTAICHKLEGRVKPRRKEDSTDAAAI